MCVTPSLVFKLLAQFLIIARFIDPPPFIRQSLSFMLGNFLQRDFQQRIVHSPATAF